MSQPDASESDLDVLLREREEARELIAFVRDWFRLKAAVVSARWGDKFPELMGSWMDKSAEWLDRHEQLVGNGDVPSPSEGVPPCTD